MTAGQHYLLRVYRYGKAINDDYDLIINGTDAAGDRLQVNDSFVDATSLGTGAAVKLGLSIHDSTDEDFFRWYAPAAGPFQANIIFEHNQGDLDLFLYEQDFDFISSSASTSGDETIQFADVTPYHAYYIRVDGYDGAINPTYDLGISAPSVPADFLEPNNSFESARSLGTGDQVHSHLPVHTADNDDYYRRRAPATGWMTADLEFLHEVGDLDLYVYDSNESLVAFPNSVADNEQLQFNVQKGDSYTFRVRGYDGALHRDYRLALDGPDIPPDRFEPNDAFGMATELPEHNQLQDEPTIHKSNNDDYFHHIAPADGQLVVKRYFEHAAGELDLYLYDAPEFDAQIDSATTSTDFEQIVHTVNAFQEYFFLVDGHLGATNFDNA